MVPIDNDWIKGLLELGECLNTTALHHDIDILDIRVEPEFGYIHVKGSKTNDAGTKVVEVFHATQWRDLGITDLKIAPQGTAIPTGASNFSFYHRRVKMDNKTILEQVSIIEDEVYNFKPIESVAKITDSMSHCSDVVTMQIYMRGLASYLKEIKEKNTSVWNKLYNLKNSLKKEQDAEEPTIDNDEPVTEDDLPFDGKEEKE